jgi:hypothetical protein
MRKRICSLVVIFIIMVALAAGAQETYTPFKVGLQVGSVDLLQAIGNGEWVSSFGAEVHIIPALSVKALAEFSMTSDYSQNNLAATGQVKNNDRTLYGGKIEALWHAIRFSGGSVYIGPAGFFHWGTGTNYYASGSTSSMSSVTDIWLGAVVGGQYLINKYFGFFAETGLAYDIYSDRYVSYDTLGSITYDTTSSTNGILFSGLTLGFLVYLN